MQFARSVTSGLEARKFGHEVKEGSQFYFIINDEEVLNRLDELSLLKEVSFKFPINRILDKQNFIKLVEQNWFVFSQDVEEAFKMDPVRTKHVNAASCTKRPTTKKIKWF